MFKSVKRTISNALPPFLRESIKNGILDSYALKSYSQEGEDMILRRLFERKGVGFYVDIGAHHPKRFSNTYFFYKRGWRGINIDAMPNSMEKFKKYRSRDVNLELAISDKKEQMTYYAFDEPALNGFSKELSESREAIGNHKIIFSKTIETIRLEEVLNKYLPESTSIDFMSVDVEGLDVEVLKSNNWDKYSPMVVLCEEIGAKNLKEIEKSEIYAFMIDKKYSLFAKAVNTLIFIRNKK